MSEDTPNLPASWVRCTIGQIAIVNPSSSTVVTEDQTCVSFIPMAAVAELTGAFDLSDKRPFSEVKKGFTRFKDDDLLVAKITPSMENGKSAVVRGLEGGVGCGSTEFHVVRSEAGVEPDYLRYFVTQTSFRQVARRNMQGAVGQQRVPPGFLRDASIPLPPTAEQRRVLSKLEELFSSIDEGERALERVRRLVERYRQSVLKAAVTGELTREWREQHAGELESGEALLLRILESRRQAWEQSEGTKKKAKDTRSCNDTWKTKYVPPSCVNDNQLPNLPTGWAWVRAEEICGFITKGTTPSPSAMSPNTGDIPYIKVYNLTFNGSLNFARDPTFISLGTHTNDLNRSRVVPGDVLMNIVGPPLGKVSIVPETFPEWNMNQAVAVFRPMAGVDHQFLAFYLLSRAAQDWYKTKAKATAGQFNLTLEICRDTPIPLPSLREQIKIRELLKAEYSREENLSSMLEREATRSSSLKQSVLRAAFSGQLIPQNPTDEPASVLLERIAGERAAAPKRTAIKQTGQRKQRSKLKHE